MSATPVEIAVRLAVIQSWMDVVAFSALKAAVDAKLAGSARSWA